MTSSLTVVVVFPQLLGTYGDAGNTLALRHRARMRGLSVDVVTVDPGTRVPTSGDVYLLGGGEDRAQILAASLLDRGLVAAVDRGAVVLGVCAGLQLLGSSFSDASGKATAGLGVLDAVSRRLPQRAIGNVQSRCSVLDSYELLGFENHVGSTILGEDARPLGSITVGIGNGDGSTEGAVQGTVFGTYLHGPVLALNPGLTDHLISQVVGPLPPLADEWVDRARAHRRTVLHRAVG